MPYRLPPEGVPADVFPFVHDERCHLFFMLPERGQIGHHSSTDLLHWEQHPIAIGRGYPGEPDCRGVATGSVVHHAGRFYLFYTGNQNICLATSEDLNTWVKHPLNPILIPDGRLYGLANFRDPFVFRCPEDGRWWMIWGAQEAGRWGQRAGCVALAKSDDLLRWELHPPLWAPRIGPHCDCPQLIEHGGRWYLFYLQRNTRYRIADRPTGPFVWPPVRDLYTAKANAGSRPVWFRGRWIAFPFVTRLKADDDFAPWRFGGPMAIPRELVFGTDGSVGDRPLTEHIDALLSLPPHNPLRTHHVIAGEWQISEPDSLARCDSPAGGTLLLPDAPSDLYFDALATIDDPHAAVHLLLRVAVRTMLHEGYQLSLRADVGRVELRAISTYDIDPLIDLRDASIPVGRPFRIQLVLSGSILECFVGERVSMTSRIYRHRDGGMALESRDGRVTFSGIRIRALTAAPEPPASPPAESATTARPVC